MPTLPAVEARHDQMFPVLTLEEVQRLRRFGSDRSYQDGEALFMAGQPGQGMFVIVSGRVAISQRDGLGHVAAIIEEGAGAFLAEVSQLSGRPSLVDGHAVGAVTALLIPPDRLRSLVIEEAVLGERIMRALILRRVRLIETGLGGPVLIGNPSLPGMIRLQGFFARNGYPYHVVDPATDHDAQLMLERFHPAPDDLPLAVCPDGSILKNPSEEKIAGCLGMISDLDPTRLYDVVVVGAGPAGLAAAVYAASEGLDVLVLDARAFGGQAGASARIENYFGFPTGISGQALTGRAFVQAQKFGVSFGIPLTVVGLQCPETPYGPLEVTLSDGRKVQARTMVVASGARYRRPNIPELSTFDGRGVSYWASPVEAQLCQREEIVLVGGGNSAGQAAVFLADHAKTVWMLVRSKGLAESMSQYLINRISASPNITLLTETEVIGLRGSTTEGLQGVRWRHRRSGAEEDHDIRHMFLFVGADPATEWLSTCGVVLDDKGFVRTGDDAGPGQRSPLESNRPGIFAIGDVRCGSVKRVGGAIGEGANAVAQIHAFLAKARAS